MGWQDAEENVDPGFCGVKTGTEKFEPSVVLAAEDVEFLRESDLVNCELCVVELH